jgi:hypothetical protein
VKVRFWALELCLLRDEGVVYVVGRCFLVGWYEGAQTTLWKKLEARERWPQRLEYTSLRNFQDAVWRKRNNF